MSEHEVRLAPEELEALAQHCDGATLRVENAAPSEGELAHTIATADDATPPFTLHVRLFGDWVARVTREDHEDPS